MSTSKYCAIVWEFNYEWADQAWYKIVSPAWLILNCKHSLADIKLSASLADIKLSANLADIEDGNSVTEYV